MADTKLKSTRSTTTAVTNNAGQPSKGDQQAAGPDKPQQVTVADIVGEFGYYQLLITVLAFVRYSCVAMMANTGPLIAPEIQYWCRVPQEIQSQIDKPANESLNDYLEKRCRFKLFNGSEYACTSWNFNTSEHGITLTDTFDLICDKDWLRSTFQGAVTVGVVVASVIWGTFSDRHGRSFTMKVCFLCSLISGIVSYCASNFLVYTVSRAICTFGDLGLVVSLSTIIVELLGNKFRGAVCIIIYTGWAFGVMIMPWLTEYFKDYRSLMLFTIVVHLITLTWILITKESVRWLLINGRIDEAGKELLRINWWNRKSDQESVIKVNEKFQFLKAKFVAGAEVRKLKREQADAQMSRMKLFCVSIFGGLSKVGQLFQSKELAVTTMTLIWVSVNAEFLYMITINFNSDIGDNLTLNYLIGGAMEVLATILSIILISRVTRKLSLVLSLVSISSLCFALAFTHRLPLASVIILNLDKLAISTLTSLVYVVSTESFPTNLRQTGYGIGGTVGSLGAVAAPFVRTELVNLIGMTKVLIIVAALPLTAAIAIPLYLRETKGVELSDDVDEIEIEAVNNHNKRRESNLSIISGRRVP